MPGDLRLKLTTRQAYGKKTKASVECATEGGKEEYAASVTRGFRTGDFCFDRMRATPEYIWCKRIIDQRLECQQGPHRHPLLFSGGGYSKCEEGEGALDVAVGN